MILKSDFATLPPEQRVATAVAYATAAGRILTAAAPELLTDHAQALNALLHCIDNLVAQTAETLRRLDAKAT